MSTGAACHQVRKADVLVCIEPPLRQPGCLSRETRMLCAPVSQQVCLFVDGYVLVKWALAARKIRPYMQFSPMVIPGATRDRTFPICAGGFWVQSRHEYRSYSTSDPEHNIKPEAGDLE